MSTILQYDLKSNLKRKWNAYSIPLKLQVPRLFHTSGAWAALVPKFGLSRGWGSCWSMCQQMTLQDPSTCSHPVPGEQDDKVRNKAGPLTAKPRQVHSRLVGWWTLKTQTCEGGVWSAGLLLLRFPPPPSFLRVTPTLEHSTPASFCRFGMSPMGWIIRWRM